MDANISDRTYNILTRLRPDYPLFYHCNKFMRAVDNTYYFTAKQTIWLNKLHEMLQEGKRVVIPTNSLSEAKTLELSIKRSYPEKKVFLYSSETSQSEKSLHFGDVDTYWSLLDVLIFTPTCSAGISYELNHFDVVFSYFSNMSCDIETCRQMLERVRIISSKEYYICLNVMSISLPTTTEEIEHLLKNKRLDLYKDESKLHFEYDDNGEISFYKSNYYYLWLENTKINNLSKVNFINRFIDQVADTGASIDILIADEAKSILKEHKEIKTELTEKHYSDIAESNELMSADALIIKEKIRNQEDVNLTERLSLEKYTLRETYYWSDAISSNFVKKYGNTDNKRIFKNISKIVIGTSIEDSLKILEAKEITHYSTTMSIRKQENDYISESKDLLREKYIYIYHSHLYAVTLLMYCGYMCITDTKLICIDILEANIRSKTSKILEMKDKILYEYSLPKINVSKMFLIDDKVKFIKGITRFINLVLKKMYGIEILPITQEYGLRHSAIGKLFTFSEEDTSKPYIKSNIRTF